MAGKKTTKIFARSIPTASSPDARWGMVGLVAGFLLFALPLAIHFFEKGGILMLPDWVWIGLGILTMIVWLLAAIAGGVIFCKWWRNPKPETVITAIDIRNLTEANWQLINEIRQERNDRNNKPKE